MDTLQFEARKREHIRHSMDSAHQAHGLSGLDRIHLIHEAMPDLNFDSIQLETLCLGRKLATPFYVAGMTAGHKDASSINRTLALACQERGWAMGVGSQRRDLEKEDAKASKSAEWKKLREEAPQLVLFANLGLSQLIDVKISQVRKLVEDLGAQALVVHVNALQEAIQPEGTPRFQGGAGSVKALLWRIGIPCCLEGCGFSLKTLKKIAGIGLAAVDVSGLGGTHWGRIEGARAEQNSVRALASITFANWGEPTVDAVRSAVDAFSKKKVEIWASGGVRSGLDAAKLIALGAHRVGYAKPALEAALISPEQLRLWMETQEFELKISLFCTGTESIKILRKNSGALNPKKPLCTTQSG